MSVAPFSTPQVNRCFAVLLILSSSALVLNPAALGQGAGQPRGSSTTHSPQPGIRPNSVPPPVGTTSTFPEPGVSKFISGKVSIDGGAPLTDAAIIQSICRGQRHNEAYTDRTGRFSFEFGKQRIVNSNDVDDSSTSAIATGGPLYGTTMPTSSAPGNAYSSDCELQAVLPGFTSSIVELARYQNDQVVNVGTIELHRIANVDGLTVSATTAAAPPQARKAYDKAREDETKGRLEEAEKKLAKAVSLFPNFAVAWVELGRLQAHSNRLDVARDSFNRAIAADSRLVTPYQQLAQVAFQQKQWEELVNVTERLLQLNPISFPEAWFNNGVGNFYLHRLEAAEKSARESLRTDLNHRVPQADYLLAQILMQNKDFTGAAEHLRSYLAHLPNGADAASVKAQLAEAERHLTGATAENR